MLDVLQDTSSACFNLSILEDSLVELVESASIAVSVLTFVSYSVSIPDPAVVFIVDNDCELTIVAL